MEGPRTKIKLLSVKGLLYFYLLFNISDKMNVCSLSPWVRDVYPIVNKKYLNYSPSQLR